MRSWVGGWGNVLVSDGAGVDEDDGAGGVLNVPLGHVEDVGLGLVVVRGGLGVDAGVEGLVADGRVHEVGGERDVDGAFVRQRGVEGGVDACRGVDRRVEDGHGGADLAAHVLERAKAAVAQRVVEHQPAPLRRGARDAHDVHERHALTKRPRHPVQRTQLAHPKRGHHHPQSPAHPRIPVRRVRRIQLVPIPHPPQHPMVLHQIQQPHIKVCPPAAHRSAAQRRASVLVSDSPRCHTGRAPLTARNTLHRLDSQLGKPLKQVRANLDFAHGH